MARDGIDTSLRTEDLLKDDTQEEAGSSKEIMSSKEMSIDLLDMLEEIQSERDSVQKKQNPNRNSDSESISLGLSFEGDVESDEFDVNEFDVNAVSAQLHMSGLQTEEFPSSNRFESWWNSNSSAFRDSLGSFRKKMGGSLNNLAPYQRRRRSINRDGDEDHSPKNDLEPPPWHKKTVRFKKFDTVFPFYKSFSRLHSSFGEDEADANHQ